MKSRLVFLLALLILLGGFFSAPEFTGQAIYRASGLRTGTTNTLGTFGIQRLNELPPPLSPGDRRIYLVRNQQRSRDVEPTLVSTGATYGVSPSRVSTALSVTNNPFAGTSLGDLDGDGTAFTRDDERMFNQLYSRLRRNSLDPAHAFGNAFCAGFGWFAQKYCGTSLVGNADLDRDGQIDYDDYRYFIQIARNVGLHRQESYYSGKSPAACTKQGEEFVELTGKKCTCFASQRSTGAYRGDVLYDATCVDPPSGFGYVQSTEGVRLLPRVVPER